MHIGIAADHGGFELKAQLTTALKAAGYQVTDFGDHGLDMEDDYPDFVAPLARAVAKGEVTRGLAICGSGVGACVAANKVPGVRAALITDSFSAHQGVEDDDMNMMCLGGRVTGQALSWELVRTFLGARFKGDERFKRRLTKVAALERERKIPMNNSKEIEKLKEISKLMRYYILTATTHAGSGHPTSSLSATELMGALLFGGIFRYDTERPEHPNNDRLIFSKGHASPLYYALWAAAGETVRRRPHDLPEIRKPPGRSPDHVLPVCRRRYRFPWSGAFHRRGPGIERQVSRQTSLPDVCPYRRQRNGRGIPMGGHADRRALQTEQPHRHTRCQPAGPARRNHVRARSVRLRKTDLEPSDGKPFSLTATAMPQCWMRITRR